MTLSVSLLNTASGTTSSSTLTVGSITASAGLLVVAVASDNAGTSGVSAVSGVADNGSPSNTYTLRISANKTNGAINDGTTLSVFTAPVTTALSGKTITISFSPNVTAKAAHVYLVTNEAAYSSSDSNASYISSWSLTTPSIASGNAVFIFTATEYDVEPTGDSDTTRGSWSAQTNTQADPGATRSQQSLSSQYKVVTSAGTQTADVSYPSPLSCDSAYGYLILTEITDVELDVPNTAITVTAPTPSITTSTVVNVDVTSVTVTAPTPIISTVAPLVVTVPMTSITVTAPTPAITTSAVVDVCVTTVTVTAQTPSISVITAIGLSLHWCPSLRKGYSQIYDLSGNRNHGTLVNLDPATDWVLDNGLYALDFDGTGDTVKLYAAHRLPDPFTGISLCAWVKFHTYNDDPQIILAITDGDVGTEGFTLELRGAVMRSSKWGGIVLATTGVTPNTEQWYHLVYTFDGTYSKIYLDGVLKQTTTTQPVALTPTHIIAGSYTATIATENLNGRLDDIRIYGVALPADYILSLSSRRGYRSEQRSYYAFLSSYINAQTLRYGSDDHYLFGHWYQAKIIDWPEPSDSQGDDFVLLTADSFAATLDDADHGLFTLDDYWLNTRWTVVVMIYHDAYTAEHYTRQLLCTEWERQPGQIRLQLEDMSSAIMEKLYPEHTYNADGTPATYPDLLDTDVGRPVPIVVGYGIKVPCALLDNNDGAGPWIYGVCEKLSGWYYDVDYVYRGTGDGGPLVSASEYTQTTYTGDGYDLVALSFAEEQTDFSGEPYTIWVDLKADTADPPTTKYNAATEASRLLTWVGLTPDTTSFTSAETVASAANMWVDWCYGRDGNQTTIQALLDKLLRVLRGQIYRADDGEWEIWQDTSGSPVASYDEDAGDLITVSSYQQPPLPATVKLAYQPDISDPSKLKHTLSRTISGGLGDVLYEAEMVRDFTAADYLHSYLTLRAQYAKTAEATVYGVQHSLGEIITVANDSLWSGDKNWMIWGVRRIPDGNQLSLREYNATVYSYVPGTEPSDGNTDAYGADYSSTLPLAPSAFAVTGSPSSGIEEGNGGICTAWVNLICTPPAINWKKIYFGTSDGMAMVEGTPSGSNYVGTLRGLIPGKEYTLMAWCENATGLSGLAGVITTNYATITHNAATDSAAPAAPAKPTVAQGTGKSINVTWVAVAATDVAGYILTRATSAGGSYAEVWRGNALTKNDSKPTLSYGSTYYYKVAAYDYSGNTSAYSSASDGVALDYISGGSSGEVRNIDATYITAGTITGRDIQTASGSTKVIMSAADNQVRVISSNYQWGTFGIKTVSGDDWVILDCGLDGTNYFTKYAARFYNSNFTLPTVTIHNNSSGTALLISKGGISLSSGVISVVGEVSASALSTTNSGDIESDGNIMASDSVYVGNYSGIEILLTGDELRFIRRGGSYSGDYVWFDFSVPTSGSWVSKHEV